jgi:hypothetical protein
LRCGDLAAIQRFYHMHPDVGCSLIPPGAYVSVLDCPAAS